jgi:F-type H+-transporting ATPase subunit gamma
MTDTTESLRHKIASAGDLKSVVRTMKALAASSISQYETAVHALDDYYCTVQLGLLVCFRQNRLSSTTPQVELTASTEAIGAVVFGSDQGLVGQFNDLIATYAVEKLTALSGKKILWAVGERVQLRLSEANLEAEQLFNVPNIISQITPLVGQILIEIENQREKGGISQVYLFYNRSKSGAVYEPVQQRLLPPDEAWLNDLNTLHWPSKNLPEIINGTAESLPALMREYLFVSLFRACAESLASENASRLAAMQRAEKNIAELLEDLNRTFHRLRQNAIDEELFDVISGFEALANNTTAAHAPLNNVVSN